MRVSVVYLQDIIKSTKTDLFLVQDSKQICNLKFQIISRDIMGIKTI